VKKKLTKKGSLPLGWDCNLMKHRVYCFTRIFFFFSIIFFLVLDELYFSSLFTKIKLENDQKVGPVSQNCKTSIKWSIITLNRCDDGYPKVRSNDNWPRLWWWVKKDNKGFKLKYWIKCDDETREGNVKWWSKETDESDLSSQVSSFMTW